MSGIAGEAGREKGNTGKLIAETGGGPGFDSIGYYETMIEYYLPGVAHRELSDEAFAQKLAHLEYIRNNSIPK